MSEINGMAIASFVLGIVSLLLFWIPILGWILFVLAIVFGFIALNQLKKNKKQEGKGFAMTGLITGFVSLALSIIIGIIWLAAIASLGM
jgi:uncharacterized membrane protein